MHSRTIHSWDNESLIVCLSRAFPTKQGLPSDGLSESFTNHTPHPLSSYLLSGAGEGPRSPGNRRCFCTSSHLQTGGLPLAAVSAGVFGGSSGEGLCGIANELFRAVRSSIKRSGDLGRRRVPNAPYWKFCSQASWGKERTVAKITLMFYGFFVQKQFYLEKEDSLMTDVWISFSYMKNQRYTEYHHAHLPCSAHPSLSSNNIPALCRRKN